MKRKSFTIFYAILACFVLFMTSCGNNESNSSEEDNRQFITKEDLKTDVTANSSEYTILDVRKSADYDEQHIQGAYSADLDSSINGTDDDTSKANLKTAITDATGSETGDSDTKYVLICYSGNRYAIKATELLIDMGISEKNIYTLEGGNDGWTKAGDDFTDLME